MADTGIDLEASASTPVLQFVTETVVAEHLNVGVGTLRHWRRLGGGPPWYKLGKGPKAPVKYDLPESIAWAKDQRRSAE